LPQLYGNRLDRWRIYTYRIMLEVWPPYPLLGLIVDCCLVCGSISDDESMMAIDRAVY
jgi:hypothetical protein